VGEFRRAFISERFSTPGPTCYNLLL